MNVLAKCLLLILFLICHSAYAYIYDADTQLEKFSKITSGDYFEQYDGTSNLCNCCLSFPNKILQENALDGSFFAFEVGYVAPKGTKPLLGQNPKIKKDRTNTDLGDINDPAVAKSIFRNQTKGQKVQQFENNGNIRRRAEDGTQIRQNSNGSVRLDLPGRGSQPNGETIHLSGKKGG